MNYYYVIILAVHPHMCSFLVHTAVQFLLQQEFPIIELYLMAGGEILKFCRSSWALTCF